MRRFSAQVPSSQLDLSNPMTEIFVYAPAFEGASESADHPVQEVAISLNGGKEYIFLDSYIPDFPVLLTSVILEVVTGRSPFRSPFRRGTLRVSVQPIDAGGMLRGLPNTD